METSVITRRRALKRDALAGSCLVLLLAFCFSSISHAQTSTVWVEDALPAGATPAADGGDSWNWINNNPLPYSGALAHQSGVASGEHQHYFYNAAATLSVAVGEGLFSYVYLDPANPPSEVMLQWNDGSWEHRAYWGANLIPWGADGTVSRHAMGSLPAVGQWVRLEVAASAVGLEGHVLNGMAFTLADGRATWDYAGLSGILCVRHTMSSERNMYAEASEEDAESQRCCASGGVAQDPAGVA